MAVALVGAMILERSLDLVRTENEFHRRESCPSRPATGIGGWKKQDRKSIRILARKCRFVEYLHLGYQPGGELSLRVNTFTVPSVLLVSRMVPAHKIDAG